MPPECPSGIRVYEGDKIKATITYTNQSSETLTCDVIFWVYRIEGDYAYLLQEGYVKGRTVAAGSSDTVEITSLYGVPPPSDETPINTYYDLLVAVGRDYDPTNYTFAEVYAVLECRNVVYYTEPT